MPRRCERAGNLVRLADQQPAGDHALGQLRHAAQSIAHASSSGRSRFAATVGAAHRRSTRRSCRRTTTIDPVHDRVLRRGVHARRDRCRAPSPAPTRAAPRRSPAPPSRTPGRQTAAAGAPRHRASAPGTAAWSRARPSRTPAPDRSPARRPLRTAGSHGGRTAEPAAVEHERAVKRPPPLVPVVGDLGGTDLDQRRPAAAVRSGSAGNSPGAPYTAYSTIPSETSASSTPARRQLEQLGQHELRVLAPDPNRQTDHAPELVAAEGPPELVRTRPRARC